MLNVITCAITWHGITVESNRVLDVKIRVFIITFVIILITIQCHLCHKAVVEGISSLGCDIMLSLYLA